MRRLTSPAEFVHRSTGQTVTAVQYETGIWRLIDGAPGQTQHLTDRTFTALYRAPTRTRT